MKSRAFSLVGIGSLAFLLLVPHVTYALSPSISWHSTGDSYSSGEGISGAGGDCVQSNEAYGPLTVQMLREQEHWDIGPFAFTACTGLKVEHFYNKYKRFFWSRDKGTLWDWAADQAEEQGASGDARFDIVTLTFSGNDLNFQKILFDCLPGTWLDLIERDWVGFVLDDCDVTEDELKESIARLGEKSLKLKGGQLGSLADFFDSIVRDHLNPGGRLYVLGYPKLFATSSEWGLWQLTRCQGVTRGDANMLGRVAEHLNAKISSQVDLADPSKTRIHYVEVTNLFAHHELCGNEGDWINGIHYRRFGKASFHPNSEGHKAEAELLVEKVTQGGKPSPGTPSSGDTATGVVIDVSSSMDELFQGALKIDAAKAAAQHVSGLIRQDIAATNLGHRLALISFSGGSTIESGLTSDISQVESEISSLVTRGRTNMSAGLTKSLDELAGAPESTRALILLSDGIANEGLLDQALLDGPVARAVAEGVKIFTVGFGEAGELDESLLQEIASRTGGGYSFASTPWELDQSFVRSRLQSAGDLVGEFQGSVAAGQLVNAGVVSLPEGLGQFQAALTWPGSDLDLIIRDPEGTEVTSEYPGASLFTDTNPKYLIVADPKPGDWTLDVRGVETDGMEPFLAFASTREAAVNVAPPEEDTSAKSPAAPANASLIPWLLAGLGLMTAMGGGITFVAVTRSRTRCPVCGKAVRRRFRNCPTCWYPIGRGLLAIARGPDGDRRMILEHGDVLGRMPGSSHRFDDPAMSGKHAAITWVESEWMIADLGSSSGLWRNEEAVIQARLREGDQIRMGSTEFVIEGESPRKEKR